MKSEIPSIEQLRASISRIEEIGALTAKWIAEGVSPQDAISFLVGIGVGNMLQCGMSPEKIGDECRDMAILIQKTKDFHGEKTLKEVFGK
jgi:hypothetical protein